ncbi:oligosaccharyl transferase STT3 subunit [Babesia ovis]|uniref:Oligosaccharyl transferase STT3 subunit n=1 Tax=Babesia ovis TaxID=5869 RepID=A0A9W5T8N8_BABOV|nr:oligosaccharyl transferase STT3 subunit [Babesia ovis]
MDTVALSPPSKFGTMGWLNKHLTKILGAGIAVGFAFVGILCAYVVYIAKLNTMQNLLNLTIMVAIFTAMTAVSNVIGAISLGIESEGGISMFNINNICITILAIMLSGIHFGMATHNGREAIQVDSTANVFFMTGFCCLSMAILYLGLIYLGFKYRNMIKRSVITTDFKLKDGNATTSTDLNMTQMGPAIFVSNEV